jgi:hypothetical protein
LSVKKKTTPKKTGNAPKTKGTKGTKATKAGLSGRTKVERAEEELREAERENRELRRRLRRLRDANDKLSAALFSRKQAAAKPTPKPPDEIPMADPPMSKTPETGRTFRGFASERAAYAARRAELLACAEGKYVAIVGDEVEGPVDSREAAMTAGYRRFGIGPLYIKHIVADESAVEVSRDVAPCRS